jgi:DNA repair protein RecN (Recombination protein N)
VQAELAPLKLEKPGGDQPSRRGDAGPTADDIAFEVATNVGTAFRAMNKVASGELARCSLAISVCLAGTSPCGTLVFDEADVGDGGAVAAAVGERLADLGRTRQVLAITHSPQVAAAAGRQLRVAKAEAGGETVTSVEELAWERGKRSPGCWRCEHYEKQRGSGSALAGT